MDKTFNDAYIDNSILETSDTLPKTPVKRIIDKHILLSLELGVVLFKSPHYFTISNFWNSTIQELVYIEKIRYL